MYCTISVLLNGRNSVVLYHINFLIESGSLGTAQLVIYENNANVHDYEYAVYCRSCVISSLLDSLGFGIKFPVSHEAGENWRPVLICGRPEPGTCVVSEPDICVGARDLRDLSLHCSRSGERQEASPFIRAVRTLFSRFEQIDSLSECSR